MGVNFSPDSDGLLSLHITISNQNNVDMVRRVRCFGGTLIYSRDGDEMTIMKETGNIESLNGFVVVCLVIEY
jgi:hypothetical protein